MAATPGPEPPLRAAVAGAGRRDPIRRFGLLAAVLFVFAWTVSGPVRHLAMLVGVDDWGSDWRWLQDGLSRLAAGLPLNHPEYVAAPFSQMAGGPAYTWSLHPPYNATLVSPLLLLPGDLREGAWAVAMALALAAAVWLAWPRRLWWGTSLLLAAATLGPPLLGPSIGLVDQLHFANPNALVLVGLALAWWGRRRGAGRSAVVLMAAGIVLAAVKIVPAASIVAWLLAGRADRRDAVLAVMTAAAALVILTLPVLALDPGVVGDTIAVQLNLVPDPGAANLAPAVRLAPLLGAGVATWLSRAAGLTLLVVVPARRFDGPGGFVLAAAASLLLTPQLWAHWFLIPMLALLLAAGEWPPLRAFDARLRTAWTGVAPAA